MPFVVGCTDIFENFLREELCFAVRVGTTTCRVVFCDGQELRVAVNGGTGTVHEIVAVGIFHDLEQDIGPGDVILIVLKRNLTGFADSFERRKVTNAIDFMLKWEGKVS